MSIETLFDYLIMAAGTLLGWFVKLGHDAHQELKKEVALCVRKDVYRDDLGRIERSQETSFNRLFNLLGEQDRKLDSIKDTLAGKADRHELLGQHSRSGDQ